MGIQASATSSTVKSSRSSATGIASIFPATSSQRSEFVEHVRGFPANPMRHEDVETKALELLVPKLGEARARRVVDLAWSIDELPDAGVLVDAIARD